MSTVDWTWQPALDCDPVKTWAPVSLLRRRELSSGAWVDHLPGWLLDADGLFAHLAEHAVWRAEHRQMYEQIVAVPRLTAWYSLPDAPHPLIRSGADRLNRHYGSPPGDQFASAGLCLYRNGADSVAWHGDRIGRGATSDTMVAILSLGNPRALLLRPRAGGRSLRYTLGHGDLLVMGGSCQRTWDHCVPKSRSVAGPRISIQYRPAGVA